MAMAMAAQAAEGWLVRVEEPTGIERRTGELARVPLAKVGGHRQGFQVQGPGGRTVVWQVLGQELLFPVNVMGGQVAEYRVSCCTAGQPAFPTDLKAGRLPSGRWELANSRLRVVLDAGTGRIVEAYALQAGPQRSLNLVETTPDQRDPNDIHHKPAEVTGPASPVAGPNEGWSALSGGVKLEEAQVERGPLAVRVTTKNGAWELHAQQPVLWWSDTQGFRFASVSALPHMPFNRFLDCREYSWPTGPGSEEPPDHDIGARDWKAAPGGCFVYYHREENYGALSVVALSEGLAWTGAGSSRFEGRGARARVAVVVPEWRGDDTVLSARGEARRLRKPVLVSVESGAAAAGGGDALRVATPTVQQDAAALPAWQAQQLSLDGEWQLAWGEMGAGPTSEWRAVKVPGSAHLQWLPAAQIYNREASWVSSKEWWYKRTFTVPAAFAGKRVRLEFEATDYFAEAFLNGHRLGRHEGYVDPYLYDITGLVKPGEEYELRVRVWTPVHYYWKHRPYTVKGSYGGVDQKPDDITALGITRAVRLVAGSAQRIRDIAVVTRLQSDGSALVEVQAEMDGEPADAQWSFTLAPQTFQGTAIRASVPASQRSVRVEILVKQPRLWWTWDLGKPELYTLETRLSDAAGVADARRFHVGIREIQRRGDQFFLNGKRVFLRGTNIYANLWLSEMDRTRYARDLDVIQKMNVNTIRIHCHFENPEFYDLADERGLLLWQDFLEAWYPHDTEFSRHAAALYDNHIRLVRNHPSIAVWAPSDEEDLENYRDLSKHLAARASLLDPQDRWVQRSTGRWGDAHLYHGWYGDSIWEYTKMNEPLVTELGATALPAKESLDRFLKDKWPIPKYAEDWEYHRLQLPEARNAWGDLEKQTPEQLISKSQDYVSRLFQVALERVRRRKAEGAGGIFHFFAIDFWPSVTMAAIDFYRVPTKVVDTVGRSFAPVAALFDYDRDEWKTGEQVKVGLWAVNDTYRSYPGARVNWRIENTSAQGSFARSIAEDSSAKAGDVTWQAGAPGRYRLIASVSAGGQQLSENVFEFAVK
jgi:beta-mannosidase